PNCGAGFEVRAEALGPTGRKVRCSACSNQWTARATAAAPAEAVAAVAEPAPAPAPQMAPEPPPPVLAETTLSPIEPAPPEPEVEPPDIAALREAAILRPSAPTPRSPAAQEDEAEIIAPPDGPPPT